VHITGRAIEGNSIRQDLLQAAVIAHSIVDGQQTDASIHNNHYSYDEHV
jgi:hypothetical protein